MKTIYQANLDLSRLFGNTNYAVPATYYIGLSTNATINEANFTEPIGNNYARVSLANNTSNFTTASNKSIATNTAITFNTSSGDWGTAYAVGIFDSLSGGNLLFYQELTANRSVPNGTTLKFAAGALTFTET